MIGILFWFMGFNALETGFIFFCSLYAWHGRQGLHQCFTGLVTITFILFAVPAGNFGTRYGRAAVIRVGLIGLSVLMLLGYLFVRSTITFAIILTLDGNLLGDGERQQPAIGL